MTALKMTDLDLRGKRVLVREDLNMPVKGGQIQSDARIKAALPTLKLVLEKDAAVVICSHLSCSAEGEFFTENSLKPVAEYLSKTLGREVPLLAGYPGGVGIKAGDLALFENMRFDRGEKKNADELAQKYVALCDVFVMDAFGTAHRAGGPAHSVARFIRAAAAGSLLTAELGALGKALDNLAWLVVMAVANSRVSTKLDVLNSPASIRDQLIVGGSIASTFLTAVGHKVDKPLHGTDPAETVKAIAAKVKVPPPVDVVVAKEFAESTMATVKAIAEVADDDMIFDTGPQTIAQFTGLLEISKTILWNGPARVLKLDQFGEGTRISTNTIVDSMMFSITGGGDTLTAVDKYGIVERISYISTGGGAFLEFIEDKVLSAVEILEQRTKN